MQPVPSKIICALLGVDVLAGEGWRFGRQAVATGLQFQVSLGTAISLLLMRYVSEIDDDRRRECATIRPSGRSL